MKSRTSSGRAQRLLCRRYLLLIRYGGSAHNDINSTSMGCCFLPQLGNVHFVFSLSLASYREYYPAEFSAIRLSHPRASAITIIMGCTEDPAKSYDRLGHER